MQVFWKAKRKWFEKKEETKVSKESQNLKHKARMTTSTKIGCECSFVLKERGQYLIID